jgi:hypothetical protein
MQVIPTSDGLVTIINVFTVAPANQHRLVELLTQATESSVRHVPGFLSAALHRGMDGTKVTMYAQWRTVEDYQRMILVGTAPRGGKDIRVSRHCHREGP